MGPKLQENLCNEINNWISTARAETKIIFIFPKCRMDLCRFAGKLRLCGDDDDCLHVAFEW